MEPLDRIPPQSLEMEQAALGACLIDRDALETVSSILKPDDFYRAEHGQIFTAMCEMVNKGEKVDLFTVQESLKERGLLEHIGSPYLYSLTDSLSTPANAEHYARAVEEKSVARKLIKGAAAIAAIGYDEFIESSGERMAKAESVLLGIERSDSRRKARSLGLSAMSSMDLMEERYDRRGQPGGLLTGISNLDRWAQGFKPGELIVIGARTSMGKTAGAIGFALNMVKRGDPVAYFSLEMDTQSIIDRVVAMESRVDLHVVRSGNFNDDDWPKVGRVHAEFSKWPLIIDDNSQSMGTLRHSIRRHVAKDKAKAVFIDHLGLVRYEGKHQTMVHMIGDITAACKEMAKEFQIPVILLVQLSRGPENRTGHEPNLGDLRDSGTIEQDADLVILLHRAGYYKPDSPELKGKGKMIVAKHRNGPTGFIDVAWVQHLAMFTNLAIE